MNARLVIDVGNTSIAYGIFNKGELFCSERVLTKNVIGVSDIDEMLNQQLNEFDLMVDEVVICCGVSRIEKVLNASEVLNSKSVTYVNGLNPCGAEILYETPESLGPDRIANTIAAKSIYGGNVVVVDCGTAINIDFIDENGRFIGGLITSGMQTNRDALTAYAPALPEVDINSKVNLIGVNTIECIQSGIIYSAASLVNFVFTELSRDYENLKLVITGGQSHLLEQVIKGQLVIDEWMTLKGLGLAQTI